MGIPGHRSEQTGQPGLDRIQQNVRDLIALVKLVPFLFGGKLVTALVFAAATARTVRHGLGHRFNGYIVVRNYGTTISVVGETGTAAGDPLNEIIMSSPAASTYDIWFY